MVFDASTLILLAKVDLLEAVATERLIVITPIVQEESIRLGAADSRLIARLVSKGRIVVRDVLEGARDIKKLQKDFSIAAGEASSLWLAHKLGVALATDDGRTIRAAKILGVPFATAVHFLIESYRNGRLTREFASAKLEKLVKFGRYHRRIIKDAKMQLEGGGN